MQLFWCSGCGGIQSHQHLRLDGRLQRPYTHQHRMVLGQNGHNNQNYIPVRLTAILMILAALLLKEDWRNSRRILQRDRKNMASPNAGWTISTMAGALNIQLEKPGD